MNYSLIDYINNKTNCKYPYLKLVGIIYDSAVGKYIADIIYPKDVDLSDDDKSTISSYVKEFLNLKSALEIKIRKSYLEENIIFKFVKNLLSTNYPSVFLNLKEDSIKVKTDEKVVITIKCSNTVKKNIDNKKLTEVLLHNLDKNFCGNFEVQYETEEDEDYDDYLNRRISQLEASSVANMYSGGTRTRYPVNITHKLIGDPIDIMPQAISDFKGPSQNVVVAGRIKFLQFRTYKSKRPPKDPNAEPEQKPMYSFTLEDKTGKINAVIFPSKANMHKAGLLKDNDTVIVKGDIQAFGDKISLRVKSLSMCERIKQEEQQQEQTSTVAKDVPDSYVCVSPKKYFSATQTNLFDINSATDPRLMGRDFVVFDLETTGLNYVGDEIIEIGAVKIRDGLIIESFTTFVKPKNSIPEEITNITNITNEMVALAPSIKQVLPDFYKFTRGATLVAYNIPFDYGFIKTASSKTGYDFDNPQMDALVMAREKLPGLNRYNLGAVCAHMGVSLVGAHRAIHDTIATAELFLKLFVM